MGALSLLFEPVLFAGLCILVLWMLIVYAELGWEGLVQLTVVVVFGSLALAGIFYVGLVLVF